MAICPINMKKNLSLIENNNYKLGCGTHLSRPIFHRHIREQSPSQVLVQKYGKWNQKILNMHIPCLVLKTRLKNGYEKIVRVIFIRDI